MEYISNETNIDYEYSKDEIKGLKQIITSAIKYRLKDLICNMCYNNWYEKIWHHFTKDELENLLDLARYHATFRAQTYCDNYTDFDTFFYVRDQVEVVISALSEDLQEPYWKMLYQL
jgi:hypothetical protein